MWSVNLTPYLRARPRPYLRRWSTSSVVGQDEELTMAPLIVPPPFPLPLPDKRGCSFNRFGGAVPGVSHSLPVFAGFGVNRGRSAFLEALRPLPEVDYLVHCLENSQPMSAVPSQRKLELRGQ